MAQGHWDSELQHQRFEQEIRIGIICAACINWNDMCLTKRICCRCKKWKPTRNGFVVICVLRKGYVKRIRVSSVSRRRVHHWFPSPSQHQAESIQKQVKACPTCN